MRKMLAAIHGVALICFVLFHAAAAGAQDFRHDYPLAANGHLRISNISGDVKVSGYTGSTVLVVGFKEGRDRNRVQIEDKSTADTVDIRARYPEFGNCNASVNFEVKVPSNLEYYFDRISSVSGNVEVWSVRGMIKAESVSGNVDIKDITGSISAGSVSGNVTAEIVRLSGTSNMKFSSVSGNVTVKAPENLDADIEMSSVSGSLRTDFPIEVQERRYGPGRSAHGRLGSGARSLRIATVSGRVSLTRI